MNNVIYVSYINFIPTSINTVNNNMIIWVK